MSSKVVPGMQEAGAVAATWKPIGWVKRWDRNPRINAHVVAGVAKSIQEFGFGAPLITRSSGVLIAGDTRIQAAHKLGLQTVPVRVMDHLSDDEADALALADNRLAERAKWSEAGLGLVLQKLSADLRLATGFSARESTRLIGMIEEQQRRPVDLKDDVAPSATDELRRKWKTKLGDLWTIGSSRVLCGDSTSTTDLARLMNGERAVLLNTDPPYGVGYVSQVGNVVDALTRRGQCQRGRGKGGKALLERFGDIENDELQGEKLQAFLERAFAAAELTGRRCAAMELDPKYVAVLLERASSRGIPCAKVE